MIKFITPNWPAPAHIKAYTTTRHGWVSQKQDTDSQSIMTLVGAPTSPVWLDQKHTTSVVEATEENRGVIADASYTTTPNQVCAVTTADCIPVLVCDQSGTKVAAIHAGWRGLAAGVVETAIAKLNLPSDETLVWLGPSIGPTKFEVGKDVLDAFTAHDPKAAHAFAPQPDGKWLANLYQLAKDRLATLGIDQVYGGDYCTHTQEALFFSYRRDKNRLGLLASLIWLEHN